MCSLPNSASKPNIREGEINFEEIARINSEADETLNTILSRDYYKFEQYEEVSKITDIEVAKVIIKRLLDEVNKI